METALSVRLPASEKAPALARKALDALDGELTGVREQVRVLVSELVTNAVRHAGPQAEDKIELVVVEAPSAVRIEVADPGAGFEPPARPTRHVEGGFGLYLIDRIANRWGADPGAVWFELDRPAAVPGDA